MLYVIGSVALVILLINFIVGFLLLNIRDKNYWVMSTVTSLLFTLVFIAILGL
ncbi:MAG: hypothetical protein N2C11_11025 [Planococcus sp. (in: firmicutes)]|uniref:hypothetical protein n=1 Tax=Planococcus halocryophilus TaxID=1215089 RepID=UPI001F0FDDE3|nr:hypothetical protein [Planococcus halocryophilus]MCH4827263.1 hypothetical protein [Planococcus halocryophilus]